MIPEVASQTEAVLMHHLQAFSVGMDELMKDYTEESVIFSPMGVLKGTDAIRAFFQAAATPELVQAIKPVRQDIQGDFAYLLWTAEPFVNLGTDTFFIQDGKIKVQSFMLYPLMG